MTVKAECQCVDILLLQWSWLCDDDVQGTAGVEVHNEGIEQESLRLAQNIIYETKSIRQVSYQLSCRHFSRS